MSGNRTMRVRSKILAMLAAGTILGTAAPAFGQAVPSDFTSGYRYDAAHRLTGVIRPDPDGAGPLHYAAARYTYNAAGQLSNVETGELANWQPESGDPALWPGFTVSEAKGTTYDQLGRKATETMSFGGVIMTLTQFSYDSNGRLECAAVRMNASAFSTLPASACSLGTQGSYGPDRIIHNTYDAAGQALKVTKAYAVTTANGFPATLQEDYASYAYSPNGKQTSITDANSNVATAAYDGFDRKVQWTFPSPTAPGSANVNDFEAYGYDANSNRTSLRKRDGTTIVYTYDALNRVIEKDVPASITGAAAYSVFTGYDNRGLQVYARFASTGGVGLTNSYDDIGRLASATTNMDGMNRILNYQYDADGNVTNVSGDSQYTSSMVYDGLDRQSAELEGPTTIAQMTYDPLGRRSTMTQGFGTPTSSTSYAYDGISRLASLSHDLAGTSADQSLGFSYSPASQIASRTSSNDSYASSTALNVSRAYAVNGLNQYTGVGAASYTYDANGNLKTDGSNSYVYDGENRLVSSSGINTVNLAYDPMGRLWQTSGGSTGTTRFLYDGDKRILEFNGSGTVLRAYAHARGEDEPILWYEIVSGVVNRNFLHTDQQGSITAIADASGNPVAINAYDAWGIPNTTGPDPSARVTGRFGYTGQAWIPDLGMWYYRARFYSPTLGRFLQTDPIGYKDQVNLYAYVGNDPVDGRDPSGTTCTQDSNGTYSCQIDQVGEMKDGKLVFRAATAADHKKYADVEHSLTRAVNGAATSGKIEDVTVKSGGSTFSFSISAATVASNLAQRTIGVNPFATRGTMDTPSNDRTNVNSFGIDPTRGFPGTLTPYGNADRFRAITFLHEGIHGSLEEAQAFGEALRVLGVPPLTYDHQKEYNRAAESLLGPN